MTGATPRRAPRPVSRAWRCLARGVLLLSSLWLVGAWAHGPAEARQTAASHVTDGPHAAWFEQPTHRYGHAIMGDLPEWGRLCLSSASRKACVTLPATSVFEDIRPRLHDVDKDGTPEAIVVESTTQEGAALVVYQLAPGALTRIATPHIGTRNRWLAPAAVADLDGDGAVELAYIDRPHLAKRLRIWRYTNGRLQHVADHEGLTNHRIGQPFITGGLRRCDGLTEIIAADARWQRLIAARLVDGSITTRDLGPFSADAALRALHCE